MVCVYALHQVVLTVIFHSALYPWEQLRALLVHLHKLV